MVGPARKRVTDEVMQRVSDAIDQLDANPPAPGAPNANSNGSPA